MHTFSELIDAWLDNHDLTNIQAGARIGVSNQLVSAVRRAKRQPPKGRDLTHWLQALRVPEDSWEEWRLAAAIQRSEDPVSERIRRLEIELALVRSEFHALLRAVREHVPSEVKRQIDSDVRKAVKV